MLPSAKFEVIKYSILVFIGSYCSHVDYFARQRPRTASINSDSTS